MSKSNRPLSLISLAACGILLMSMPAFAQVGGNLANLDSVEVPAQSEHVVLDAAFLSPEGHLVLQTDGLDNGLRVNYYDVQTGNWLLPAAVTDKNAVIIEQRKLNESGYISLPHMPSVTLANGTKAFNMIHLRDICFRPYADFLIVEAGGKAPVARGIYIRRKAPAMILSANDAHTPAGPLIGTHSCKSAAGDDPALTANYQQESAFFMSDNGSGFFALVGRYAIHFDGDGNTNFFKGQDNPVFLSAEDTEKMQAILATADKSDAPQDSIAQAETLITDAAQKQMRDKQ